MRQLTKSNKQKLIALVNQAIPKCGDRPEIKEELEDILNKLSHEEEELLTINIDEKELEKVHTLIDECEKLYKEYVNTDNNSLSDLERIKKEFSSMLMYLSTFKDKFIIYVDYLEDVFKKEVSVKVAKEIETKENISFTQAEKKINLDERYTALRKTISDLILMSSQIKTKYDFFSKVMANITQSISVAGKEINMNR